VQGQRQAGCDRFAARRLADSGLLATLAWEKAVRSVTVVPNML
jgi:hypothetical protein